MTDTPPNGPAPMAIRPAKRPIAQRLTLVWLVPILALAISLGAAWQNYRDQGVRITIAFENAAGVTAGATEIRYRDIRVGLVEAVEFDNDLSTILVHARVDQDIAPYLDADAQFWVVRPNVSVRGISGLDTVLSGVYIEGNWNNEADVAQTNFTGLEQPVLTRAGQRGTSITLRTENAGAIAAGAPVLHKGLTVGYLEEPQLNLDGSGIMVNAFILAPYDRRITSSTRFWDVSGFSVSFGAGGVALNVNSLASLIEGGVEFDTVVSGGEPVTEGQSFTIYASEQIARDSLFVDPSAEVLRVAVLFEEAVTGLTRGSEVRFQGIRIGEVSEISAIVVGQGDQAEVRLQSVLNIQPSRLGLGVDATADDALELLSDFVTRGLRARMVTGNILSGSLQVELVQIPDALPAIMAQTSGAFPVIPTTDSNVSDVAATAEGVLARINALPVEDLMNGAINLMDSIEQLVASEDTRNVPGSVIALLEEARGIVGSEDLQAVPADLRNLIAEIDTIIASANETGIVTSLDEVLVVAASALANIDEATRNLPRITADIEELTTRANQLELEALVTSATSTLNSIDAFIAADDTRALPGSLNGALDELRNVMAEVREGGAVENVNELLASANAAARAVEDAVATLPALSAQAGRLVTQSETVIASYGDRSRFNAETLTTLREIQSAANAVSALARAIQRNPNSLITGR
ncbi:intermembrane transport protein PqiB [Yoonia sp.]|uniref:PqiB family protein n=1 Tax=Yoonia sp. TaxID=2212373 RepID=UPI003919A78E